MNTPSLEDVKQFWEQHPLFHGESRFSKGSREFFEEHREVYINDCFAGELNPALFPEAAQLQRVLDLGCGPGFWLIELAERGAQTLVGADLTEGALELTRKRCELYQVSATFSQQNAEKLTFSDGEFTHVNCSGVIHHTPNTEACVAEIARVLDSGGTALISVYYRNIFFAAVVVASLAGASGENRASGQGQGEPCESSRG